jgi:dihydroflavonol-4-reductase
VTHVFLTGGSGLIGGALADRLLERGDELVALARSDAAEHALAARGARVARGDVLDEDALASGMAGCELVYHVAGVNTLCPADPAKLFHVNVRGAEAAVRAAARAGVRRVVLTSSAASVGEPEGTVGREDTRHRGSYLSVYDRSKHHGELAAFRAAERLGVELVAVNPSSVPCPAK